MWPHWLDEQQKGTCCMWVTKSCSCAGTRDLLQEMAYKTSQTLWPCMQKLVSL